MRVISGKARGTKLNTIESNSTRPTLDRVKESLFNILQNNIEGNIILDLFAGSGAIAIEFLSRGAKFAYICDKSYEACKIIKQNLEKTKLIDNSIILNKDYKKCLYELKNINEKIDIVFLDPPYEANLAVDAIKIIKELNILKEQGSIIIETDQVQRELENLKELDIEVKDCRKYGRVSLIFLNWKGL